MINQKIMALVGFALIYSSVKVGHASTGQIDLTFTGSHNSIMGGSPLQFEVRPALYFGANGEKKWGPVIQYESGYNNVLILGGGMSFGTENFLDISAGYLKQTYQGQQESGFSGTIMPGLRFKKVRISMPILIKYITSAAKRTEIQYKPYIGLEFKL